MQNLTNQQIDEVFDKIVGNSNNFQKPDDKKKYESGYRYGNGNALRVLRPKNTEQVAQILEFCNSNKIAIVPQGGNTGLVSSSTPDSSGKQIVLSTELLNKHIFKLNEHNKSINLGAGWVLDSVNEKISDFGLFLPIDIGSSGTCNIGGIIATNAAGTRAGCYGNVKSRLIDITVVLANGQILENISVHSVNMNERLPQDNSHIDFENPFVGSGGWLGIVVSATLKLENIPAKKEAMVLVPKNNEAIKNIRKYLERKFGQNLTAFEGMCDIALKLVAKNIPNCRYLFENDLEKTDEHEYILLAEVSSANPSEELLNAFEYLLSKGLVVTGLLGKTDLYWHHRHHISEAIAKEGSVIANDIAVKGIDNLAKFRVETSKKLQKLYPNITIVPFGHEMLGALHFNIICPDKDKKRAIQQLVYDMAVNKYGGTFSAEHGIGPHNQWAYDQFTKDEIKNKSAALKQKYDPNSILNPNICYSGSGNS